MAAALSHRIFLRQQRIMDKALKEAERRRLADESYSRFLEQSSHWYWETDAEDRIKAVKGPKSIFADAQIDGLRRQDLATPEDLADTAKWANYEAAIRDRRPFSDFVYEVMPKKNETRWIRVAGAPAHDVGGKFLGYSGYAVDVTEHVRLENQLRQAQKMEAVGRLTGGIAHDFNNLLQVISANIESAKADLEAGREDWTSSVDAAENAIDRASTLTNQLLSYARQQRLTPKVFDVNGDIEDMAVMFRRLLGSAMHITVVPPPEPLGIYADRGQFGDAMLNLAVNAADAMPKGGQIMISTSLVELGIEESLHVDCPPGPYVEIRFSDTGEGIPADVIQQVFDPFYTTKPIGSGSGLGLSMTYGFVRQSGGFIYIESKPGKGTTVCLNFPQAVQASEDADASDRDAAAVSSGHETILVVEDRDDVRDVTISVIEKLGYRVLTASNGAEALELIRGGVDMDLVFSDVVMPGGISGVDPAEQVPRIRSDLPILLTSGYRDEHLISRGFIERGTTVIRKPYRMAEISRAIRSALDGEAQQDRPVS